jgi:hypothetical protein
MHPSAHHKTCAERWRGVVSLGFDADGKRIRKKVGGKTRTEVKDKLKAPHSELDAGVRSAAGYLVRQHDELPGRALAPRRGPGRHETAHLGSSTRAKNSNGDVENP